MDISLLCTMLLLKGSGSSLVLSRNLHAVCQDLWSLWYFNIRSRSHNNFHNYYCVLLRNLSSFPNLFNKYLYQLPRFYFHLTDSKLGPRRLRDLFRTELTRKRFESLLYVTSFWILNPLHFTLGHYHDKTMNVCACSSVRNMEWDS